MIQIQWKLRNLLEQHQIPALALSRAMNHKRLATLYRLTSLKNAPTRVDLPTLEALISTLRELTGLPIGLSDILEVSETKSVPVLKAGMPDPQNLKVEKAKHKLQPRVPSIRIKQSSTQVLRSLRDS